MMMMVMFSVVMMELMTIVMMMIITMSVVVVGLCDNLELSDGHDAQPLGIYQLVCSW